LLCNLILLNLTLVINNVISVTLIKLLIITSDSRLT
jgi:hypothetical protein